MSDESKLNSTTENKESNGNNKKKTKNDEIRARITNALFGCFIGDSLAMPVHWYYDRSKIFEEFGQNGITGFEDAKHPHPLIIYY